MAKARAAVALATKGSYRCAGKCKQVKPLREGVVVTWGGMVLRGICPECFGGCPIVIEESTLSDGRKGMKVRPLRPDDRTDPLVLPASDMSQAQELDTIAKKVKVDL